MAFDITTNDPVSFGSKLDWGNVLQRQYATPLDRTSLFVSEADALNYAQGKEDLRGLSGKSYPGQIITVLDGTNPKVFIISNHEVKSQRKLIPIGQGQAQQAPISTCGENCCVWFNNPESKDAVFSDEDKWLFVDGQNHELPEGLEPNATEVTVDGIKGYRAYVPAHTEDDAGNWIEGQWSNWTLIASDGSEIEVKTQSFSSNIWTLNDGVDNYVSEASDDNEKIIVVTVTKEGTAQKFLAKRDWIND